MDWSNALRDYRRRHGLTQAALAEILDVDPTTVSRWERGRDRPALGIASRLTSLIVPRTRDVERALKLLIDTTDAIAALFDDKYRLLYSSAMHRRLLGVDASALYGRSFVRYRSHAEIRMSEAWGGYKGWFRNGIDRIEYSLVRHAYERTPSPRAYAHKGMAWTIREGVEGAMVLSVTHEMPLAEYKGQRPIVWTLDDPAGKGIAL